MKPRLARLSMPNPMPYSVFKCACATLFPGMEQEYKFMPKRRWRFDLAWPKHKIACEIEGGIWTNGRHTRGKGYEADCEKYSTAAINGWTVIRVTPGMISSGQALGFLEVAFLNVMAAMNDPVLG